MRRFIFRPNKQVASILLLCVMAIAVLWYIGTHDLNAIGTNTTTVHIPAPKPKPLYSQAMCVGTVKSDANRNQWLYRSCHLKNVCYDGNGQSQLIYYRHPEDDHTVDQLSVNQIVPYQNDHRAVAKEQRVILKSSETIPLNATWPHHGQRVVTVLMNWFIPAVWSHLLMDNLFPIYRLMEMFSLLDTGDRLIEPLYMDNPCPPTNPECSIGDSHYKANLTALLSYGRWPLMRIMDKYPLTVTCFEDVLIGPSLFTDHGFGSSQHGRAPSQPDWLNWGIGKQILGFRNFILSRALNLTSVPVEYDVVFLSKGKQAWINNQLDLTYLVSQFNQSAISMDRHPVIMADVRMELMPFTDQLLMAMKSKVIVAQEGSTSFGALYLPPGGTLILIGPEGLDYYFWDNVAHIHTRYFPLKDIPLIINSIWSGLARWQINESSPFFSLFHLS